MGEAAAADVKPNSEYLLGGDATAHKRTPRREEQATGDGTGVPANVRLYRFDTKGPLICGGLISSKKGPKQFCISTVCGLAHSKKVFDRLGEGNYYIIEPGRWGGISSQPLRALFKPSLPKAAAKYSANNREVLEVTNSMEGWLSLFRYLIEAEARGAETGPNPELASFATRARQSAFTTPLRGNVLARPRYNFEGDEEDNGVPPMIMDLQGAIMGVQGELGVLSPSASYITPHDGVRSLGEELSAVGEQIKVMRSNNQSKMGALKFEAAQASARSQEVKRWMEQTQTMGEASAEVQRLQTEVGTLKSRCDFLEGAFAQMATFVTSLKDKVDRGGSFGGAAALSSSVFVTCPELATSLEQVKVTGFHPSWVTFLRYCNV
jgi:hypothetical protein